MNNFILKFLPQKTWLNKLLKKEKYFVFQIFMDTLLKKIALFMDLLTPFGIKIIFYQGFSLNFFLIRLNCLDITAVSLGLTNIKKEQQELIFIFLMILLTVSQLRHQMDYILNKTVKTKYFSLILIYGFSLDMKLAILFLKQSNQIINIKKKIFIVLLKNHQVKKENSQKKLNKNQATLVNFLQL